MVKRKAGTSAVQQGKKEECGEMEAREKMEVETEE